MLCSECSKNNTNDKPLHGILEFIYDFDNKKNLYLPVEDEFFPNLPIGNTPLFKPDYFKDLGFKNTFIKNDSLNPTGSLKDRASFLVAASARKYKIKEIVVASTGNAGSSMAGIGAASGIKIKLFVPENIPEAKLVQALQYGAEVIPVKGNYDFAYDLSIEYSFSKKILSRNTAYNPMTIEGKKTVVFEIFNDLGRIPDYIFLPAGDGVILGGVYKGLTELYKMGKIKMVPKVYAVQSEKSNALTNALIKGYFERIKSDSIADSINVDVPRNGYYALGMLKKYNGDCIIVKDNEILDAQFLLSSKTGVFAEPAASASFAGFMKIKDKIEKDKFIVILITGTGLKDIQNAARIINIPESVKGIK